VCCTPNQQKDRYHDDFGLRCGHTSQTVAARLSSAHCTPSVRQIPPSARQNEPYAPPPRSHAAHSGVSRIHRPAVQLLPRHRAINIVAEVAANVTKSIAATNTSQDGCRTAHRSAVNMPTRMPSTCDHW
jgi:hypothetical protein